MWKFQGKGKTMPEALKWDLAGKLFAVRCNLLIVRQSEQTQLGSGSSWIVRLCPTEK